MKILKVIPYKLYVNKKTGNTASIFSSYPGQDYEIEVRGYTWLKDDGTTGLGRLPAKTEAEAIEVMNKFNKGN